MPDFIPTDLTNEVADLISGASRKLRRSLGHRLEEVGLTHGRMRALWRLGRAGAPVRMGELAEALGIVPRSATSIVDELTEAGLVARVPDPDDRRATLVQLTDAGRRVLVDVKRMRAEAAAEVLGPVSDADLRSLRDLLGPVREMPVAR